MKNIVTGLTTLLLAATCAAYADSAEGTVGPNNVATESFEVGAIVGPACTLTAFNAQKIAIGPMYWTTLGPAGASNSSSTSIQCNPGVQFTLSGLDGTGALTLTNTYVGYTSATIKADLSTTVGGTATALPANYTTTDSSVAATDFTTAKTVVVNVTVPQSQVTAATPVGVYKGTVNLTLTITAPALSYP